MSTIGQIVRDRKGRAGSNGSWRIEHGLNDNVELWHYSTLMLSWIDTSHGACVTYISTGHGSVSDQGGMNQAFRLLNLPYRFVRAGGAVVVDYTDGSLIW